MPEQLEHIRFLVTKEILGKLSAEEKAALMEEVASNPIAEETREDMLAVSQNPELLNYLQSDRPGKQSAIVLEKLSNRKKKTRIIYSFAAASAAAVALFFAVPAIFQFNSDRSHPSSLKMDSVAAAGKSVQIQVSGGPTLELKEDTSEFYIGTYKMKSSGKTLTYTALYSKELRYATLTVPPAKDYTLMLPDGSEVHLNAASTIRFPMAFDSHRREISLSGEAFIKVAINENAPFRVRLGQEVIEVLGTEFNVNGYDSLHRTVSLVSGKVRVITEKAKVELKPGEEAVITQGKLSRQTFDPYTTLSWLDGRYVLSNVTLEEVCLLLGRLYGVSVEVDNKTLLKSRFTGKILKGQPIEQVLRGLESTNGITYRLDSEGIYHIK
jgi:transmembrane sensor